MVDQAAPKGPGFLPHFSQSKSDDCIRRHRGTGTVFSQINTCGSSVAVGARCTLSVTWFVSSGKLKNVKCDIGDNAINGPQEVPIIGFGV